MSLATLANLELKMRAIAVAERACFSLVETINNTIRRMASGEAGGGESIQSFLAISDKMLDDGDREAVRWFLNLPNRPEQVAIVCAALRAIWCRQDVDQESVSEKIRAALGK
jgi:hypothetical protein